MSVKVTFTRPRSEYSDPAGSSRARVLSLVLPIGFSNAHRAQKWYNSLGFWLVSFLLVSALGSRMLPVARFTTFRKYRTFLTTSVTGKCI